MKNREEWQAFFKEQLYKLETDDIAVLKWIYDRRDDASKKSSKPKTANMTRKDYPDTRGYYEE